MNIIFSFDGGVNVAKLNVFHVEKLKPFVVGLESSLKVRYNLTTNYPQISYHQFIDAFSAFLSCEIKIIITLNYLKLSQHTPTLNDTPIYEIANVN